MTESEKQYIAIDGDDVGRRLEYFMLTNDSESLQRFAATFSSAMSWLQKELSDKLEATIIFSGGDNLLACIDTGSAIPSFEVLRREFAAKSDTTLSIGVGDSPQQAYLALKLAKAGGKDRVQRIRMGQIRL